MDIHSRIKWLEKANEEQYIRCCIHDDNKGNLYHMCLVDNKKTESIYDSTFKSLFPSPVKHCDQASWEKKMQNYQINMAVGNIAWACGGQSNLDEDSTNLIDAEKKSLYISLARTMFLDHSNDNFHPDGLCNPTPTPVSAFPPFVVFKFDCVNLKSNEHKKPKLLALPWMCMFRDTTEKCTRAIELYLKLHVPILPAFNQFISKGQDRNERSAVKVFAEKHMVKLMEKGPEAGLYMHLLKHQGHHNCGNQLLLMKECYRFFNGYERAEMFHKMQQKVAGSDKEVILNHLASHVSWGVFQQLSSLINGHQETQPTGSNSRATTTTTTSSSNINVGSKSENMRPKPLLRQMLALFKSCTSTVPLDIIVQKAKKWADETFEGGTSRTYNYSRQDISDHTKGMRYQYDKEKKTWAISSFVATNEPLFVHELIRHLPSAEFLKTFQYLSYKHYANHTVDVPLRWLTLWFVLSSCHVGNTHYSRLPGTHSDTQNIMSCVFDYAFEQIKSILVKLKQTKLLNISKMQQLKASVNGASSGNKKLNGIISGLNNMSTAAGMPLGTPLGSGDSRSDQLQMYEQHDFDHANAIASRHIINDYNENNHDHQQATYLEEDDVSENSDSMLQNESNNTSSGSFEAIDVPNTQLEFDDTGHFKGERYSHLLPIEVKVTDEMRQDWDYKESGFVHIGKAPSCSYDASGMCLIDDAKPSAYKSLSKDIEWPPSVWSLMESAYLTRKPSFVEKASLFI